MSTEAIKLAIEWIEKQPAEITSSKYDVDSRYAVLKELEEALKQEQDEPLEYWNAVEGWVKLDEVREHFDSVSCGTIYKNGGEGRVPLCLAQPKQEQGEPVAWESVLGAVARGWCYEENANKIMDSELAVAIAKEVHALYTTPQQRTWVDLTDDEMLMIYGQQHEGKKYSLGRMVQQALKDKNT